MKFAKVKNIDAAVIYCLIDINKLIHTLHGCSFFLLALATCKCIIKFFWFIIFFSSLFTLLSIQQSLQYHARLFITERKIDMILTSSWCWLLRFAFSARVHFYDCWWHISYKLMNGISARNRLLFVVCCFYVTESGRKKFHSKYN